jgi:hypothetical protein
MRVVEINGCRVRAYRINGGQGIRRGDCENTTKQPPFGELIDMAGQLFPRKSRLLPARRHPSRRLINGNPGPTRSALRF